MTENFDELLIQYKELEKDYFALAKEKAKAEIVTEFLNSFSAISGIENIASMIVSKVMGALGGVEVILYYQIQSKWFSCDSSAMVTPVTDISDSTVVHVISTQAYLEVDDDTHEDIIFQTNHEMNSRKAWIYPMICSGELIGVLKMEGVFLNYSSEIRSELGFIVDYFALILRNEANKTNQLLALNNQLHKEQQRLLSEIKLRKKAEREIQEKDEYLRSIYETSTNIAIIVTNIGGHDTTIQDMSPGAEQVFQCKRDQVLYKKVSIFHTPESIKRFPKMQRDLHKYGKSETEELQLTTYTGNVFPALFTLFPKYDDKGNLIGTIELTIDISKQKEADERYRKVLQSSFDGFWIVDEQGTFVEVNDAYYLMSGYRKGDLQELTVCNIDANFSREEIIELRDTVKKNGHIHFESKHFKQDRSKIEVEVNMTYSSEMKSFFVFLKDITIKKQQEREQAFLKEQNVLMQKQESIGRLAGGIAHDLNNMLSPILGYSELLKYRDDLSETVREQIGYISQSAEKSRDLVKQLLAYSRKQTLVVKPFDINSIILKFEPLLRHTIRENITIDLKLAENLPKILCDKGNIEQVLMNLIVNAKDAIKTNGKITILTNLKEHLQTPQVNFSTEHIELTITDTGRGMSDEIKESIFEPFFSTKGKQGSGLGMATVFGIIKQHKGYISVESGLSKGTSISIFFPVSNMSNMNTPAEEVTQKEPLLPLKNSFILLVEDDFQVRLLATSIMEQMGLQVTSFANSEEALQFMDTTRPPIDLLLTDLILPGINGKELYEKLSNTFSNLKVIYMSGYTDEIISDQSNLLKQEQFIQKPFSVRDLKQVIATSLSE